LHRNKVSVIASERLTVPVIGIAIPFACTFVAQLFFIWGKHFAYEGLAILAYGVAGIFVGRQRPQSPWSKLFTIYALLPVGMIVDATIHLNLHNYTYDRNMLPLEIIYFAVIAVLPLVLGSFIGRKRSQTAAIDSRANGDA
jgi:hypothetical protein